MTTHIKFNTCIIRELLVVRGGVRYGVRFSVRGGVKGGLRVGLIGGVRVGWDYPRTRLCREVAFAK